MDDQSTQTELNNQTIVTIGMVAAMVMRIDRLRQEYSECLTSRPRLEQMASKYQLGQTLDDTYQKRLIELNKYIGNIESQINEAEKEFARIAEVYLVTLLQESGNNVEAIALLNNHLINKPLT